MTELHEDAEALGRQLGSLRLRVAELEQLLADRIREVRHHELQVVAIERERRTT